MIFLLLVIALCFYCSNQNRMAEQAEENNRILERMRRDQLSPAERDGEDARAYASRIKDALALAIVLCLAGIPAALVFIINLFHK